MFGSILQKCDQEEALEVLQRVYPDKDEFVSLSSFSVTDTCKRYGLHPLLWAIDEELEEVIYAMLEYMGNRLPEFILSLEHLDYLLEVAPEELVRDLLGKFPTLLENERFFMACLAEAPLSIRKDFINQHKGKLSQISETLGIPYFWHVLLGAGNNKDDISSLTLECIKENPKLLDLKSIDGLTFQDFVEDVLGAKSIFKKFKRKLNYE